MHINSLSGTEARAEIERQTVKNKEGGLHEKPHPRVKQAYTSADNNNTFKNAGWDTFSHSMFVLLINRSYYGTERFVTKMFKLILIFSYNFVESLTIFSV